MSHQKDERVSLRAFSRYIGVSDTFVRKQIFDTSRNPNGALKASICKNESNDRPMLFKEMAVTEWVAAGLTVKNRELLARLTPLINTAQDPLWKEDVAPGANQEQTKDNIIPSGEKPVYTHTEKNSNNIVPLGEGKNLIHAEMGAYEAKNYGEVLKAGKLELEYLQLKGKLVDKDAVYKLLFEFGQEVRNAVLQIPSRITSQMLACDTEREAQEMLRSELENTLMLLARGPKQTTAEDEPTKELVA